MDVELERGEVEAAWKGLGDGLAVARDPVVRNVSISVYKALWTSLTTLP